MSKMKEFENFILNLEQNKAEVVTKLAAAESKVAMFQSELTSAQAMLPVAQSKMAEFKELYDIDPTSQTAAAQYAIWADRTKSYQDKVDTMGAALELAQKELADLQKEHTALDVTPYAEAATLEMKKEIASLYDAYVASINDAVKAREVYLESLTKVNQARNAGRNAVVAGQRAQSFAKVNNLGNNVNALEHFSTPVKQFIVGPGDVEKA